MNMIVFDIRICESGVVSQDTYLQMKETVGYIRKLKPDSPEPVMSPPPFHNGCGWVGQKTKLTREQSKFCSPFPPSTV